jgi:hypothetical protein
VESVFQTIVALLAVVSSLPGVSPNTPTASANAMLVDPESQTIQVNAVLLPTQLTGTIQTLGDKVAVVDGVPVKLGANVHIQGELHVGARVQITGDQSADGTVVAKTILAETRPLVIAPPEKGNRDFLEDQGEHRSASEHSAPDSSSANNNSSQSDDTTSGDDEDPCQDGGTGSGSH